MAGFPWRRRLLGALKVWAVAVALFVAQQLIAGAAVLYWSEQGAIFRVCAQGASPAQVHDHVDAVLDGRPVREVHLLPADEPHHPYCTTGQYRLTVVTEGRPSTRRTIYEYLERPAPGVDVAMVGYTTSLRGATGLTVALAVSALAVLGFWWWTRRGMPPLPGVSRRRTATLSLAAFAAAALGVQGFGWMLQAFGALPDAPPGLDLPSGGGFALLAAAVLAAPVIEEVIFRYWLLGRWAPLIGAVPALLLTSLVFAVIHMDFSSWALGGRLIVGLALGALWLRTRSLLACMAVHAAWNAAVLALLQQA